MAKIRNLSDVQQEIAFTEFDYYQQYVETFKTSELGRIQSLLPLREMAITFGVIEEKVQRYREGESGLQEAAQAHSQADTKNANETACIAVQDSR